jgi:hypothetical protein
MFRNSFFRNIRIVSAIVVVIFAGLLAGCRNETDDEIVIIQLELKK